MCRFINIIVPANIDTETIASLLSKHALGCRFVENNFLIRQIEKHGILINTTVNHCDCGSVIASDVHNAKGDELAKDLERLRKKGWSETKIHNWVANKTKANEKEKEREAERDHWMRFLHEAIMENNTRWVGLFIHDY